MFGLLDVIDNGWVLQPSLRTCPLSLKESGVQKSVAQFGYKFRIPRALSWRNIAIAPTTSYCNWDLMIA
jgi:hypothetical protein